jgi:hypothetical protein
MGLAEFDKIENISDQYMFLGQLRHQYARLDYPHTLAPGTPIMDLFA